MLTETLRERLTQAMKFAPTDPKEEKTRDVLRVVLADVDALRMGKGQGGRPVTDEQVSAIMRRVIQGNEETMLAIARLATQKLREENEILASFLPIEPTVEEIMAKLDPIAADLRAAKGDGQATGLAVKTLKQAGLTISGDKVANLVKQIRSIV